MPTLPRVHFQFSLIDSGGQRYDTRGRPGGHHFQFSLIDSLKVSPMMPVARETLFQFSLIDSDMEVAEELVNIIAAFNSLS